MAGSSRRLGSWFPINQACVSMRSQERALERQDTFNAVVSRSRERSIEIHWVFKCFKRLRDTTGVRGAFRVNGM